jgi:hypothetical protein
VLSIDFNVGNIVFEHGGDVDLGVALRRQGSERKKGTHLGKSAL